jgi:hypothetical protein
MERVKCVKYFCPFYCDSLRDNLVDHVAVIERCRGIFRGGGKPKIRPIPIVQKNGKRGENLKFYHLPGTPVQSLFTKYGTVRTVLYYTGTVPAENYRPVF